MAARRGGEENAPTHIRAAFMGSDVLVPVRRRTLALGTWQGIFFCEFDGPRDAPSTSRRSRDRGRGSARFGKTQAVAGLSFRVEPGTITGFLGPNGAGKSTTLRRARARPSGRGQRDRARRPVPRARPAAAPRRRGARSERVHLGRSGRTTCACRPRLQGYRPRGSRSARARRAEREREAARQGLFARHAATARARDRSARRPRGARARRARQRPRPGRDQVAADFLRLLAPRAARSSSPATSSPRSPRPSTGS